MFICSSGNVQGAAVRYLKRNVFITISITYPNTHCKLAFIRHRYIFCITKLDSLIADDGDLALRNRSVVK